MSYNATNLLLSLASAMSASILATDAVTVTPGEDLFVHDLPASASNRSGGAAVLRLYGGPAENELRPVPVVSVQCMTYAPGGEPGAGLLLAQRLYDALHDPDNSDRPRQSWSIDAKTLNDDRDLVDDVTLPGGWDIRLVVPHSGPPGIIARGGESSGGRQEISFNFDVRFTRPQ